MLFRQLIDHETSTFTYLLGCERTRDAVLIDPVLEQVERDVSLLGELNLNLRYVIDTHVHADHVTAASALRGRTGCKTVLSARAGAQHVDIAAEHGTSLSFGIFALEARATPGHTSTCTTWLTADLSRAFTGDALLIRGCGRTDFQQGDARTLYRSVHDQVFSLPDATHLYPGHDYKGRTMTTVREEKLHNPRLGGGRTEDDFVAIMDGLKLAYPKRMDEAVPANLVNGQVEGLVTPALVAGPWPDLSRTASGAPQVEPSWVATHGSTVRLVDVRQPDEFTGPLSHVQGAQLVPLDMLDYDARGWDRGVPTVVICRSGGRSDRAAHLLETLGFRHVASMTGGMQRWAELGLPTATGASRQG